MKSLFLLCATGVWRRKENMYMELLSFDRLAQKLLAENADWIVVVPSNMEFSSWDLFLRRGCSAWNGKHVLCECALSLCAVWLWVQLPQGRYCWTGKMYMYGTLDDALGALEPPESHGTIYKFLQTFLQVYTAVHNVCSIPRLPRRDLPCSLIFKNMQTTDVQGGWWTV